MEPITEDGHPAIGPLPPSPRRPKPLVTNLLVVANVVVFLLQIFRWGLENSIAWYGQDQVAIWDGELWRLLTAPFLHGGWGHLVINCLGLFLLGEIIESYLGKRRLLAVYGVAGIAGGLMFQAFPATIGVGASGAVYGLAGVLLVLRFGHVVDGRFRLRPSFYLVALTLSLLDWLFAELLARAALVHVATTAHLGGLVSGMVIGYIFQHPERPVSSGRRWTLGLAGSVCLIAVFAYSCYYPFLNPVWPVWRRIQIGVAEGRVDTADTRAAELLSPDLVRRVISNLVEAGKQIEARGRAAEDQTEDQEARERSFAAARRRYEQAVGIWNLLRGGDLKRAVGYPLFDELMGIEADDLAKGVLAELIELAWHDLGREDAKALAKGALVELIEKARPDLSREELKRADALNDLAWFLALQGERLREALECAEAAVSLIRGRPEDGFLSFADRLHAVESAYLNTLGWVQFLIAEETDVALKNLREATELAPLGPNFLYLGMAYASLGDERAAVEALRRAEESGGLSAREQRLFRDIKEELGL